MSPLIPDKDHSLAVAGFFAGAAISFIALWLSILFKRDDKKMMVVSFGAFVVFSYLAYYTYNQSLDQPHHGHEPGDDNNTPHPRPPTAPPVILPASPASEIDLRPRIFIGTLPPEGNPAVYYTLTNWSNYKSANNIWIELFIVFDDNLRELDQRQIDYLATGDSKKIGPFPSPSSSGRVGLCISYSDNSSQFVDLFYFRDENEYMRYPPFREMTTFRDKDKLAGGMSCNSTMATLFSKLSP